MNQKNDHPSIHFEYSTHLPKEFDVEKMSPGLKDGLLYIADRQKYFSRTNYRRNITIREVSEMYGYKEPYLQAFDEDSGLFFLYERSFDDHISTAAHKAVILDNDGFRWKIVASSSNPYIKEAFENAYTDVERSVYRVISPEVFGALGHGHDDTKAFEDMMDYIPCMEYRVITLRSQYLITRDFYINTPLTMLGSDSILDIYKTYQETKDFNLLKEYPYAIILRDCNIYALCNDSAIQVDKMDLYQKEINRENDNSHYMGLMDLGTGMIIRLYNMLVIAESFLDQNESKVPKKSYFTQDERYVTTSNVIGVGLEAKPIGAHMRNPYFV